MILMIDNYDSFTYNLVQYLWELGQEVETYRNDQLTCEDVARLKPQMIVISPGPCSPTEAGVSLEVIEAYAGRIPILGVCLGHQAIGQVLGAHVQRALKPVHGKTSSIQHDGRTIFADLPNPLKVCRYHSLSLNPAAFPSALEISAWSEEGEIMAIRHRDYLLEGVQFHPEAILTEGGKQLLKNFISLALSKKGHE